MTLSAGQSMNPIRLAATTPSVETMWTRASRPDPMIALRGTLSAFSRSSMMMLTETVSPEGASGTASRRVSRTLRAPVAGSTRGSICSTVARTWRCCPAGRPEPTCRA